MSVLKVLHTSDWHLGRRLHGRRRYHEFEAFLDWLLEVIDEQGVDLLLLAGDVFDTAAPSNRAQTLYYRFLNRVAGSRCRHVVVIGGNHDSPSFLDAPKALLRALSVHVVGAASADPADEVLTLRDGDGEPLVIVAAVPYLRDRDLRRTEPGESPEEKARKLVAGIARHYAEVGRIAAERRAELGGEVPVIGMGHLFAAGGSVVEGDGVRELYVGSLAHVGGQIFPNCFDYLALGHLHVPQRVGGDPLKRYSGSPIAMGFGEAGQRKQVCLVTFGGQREPAVTSLEVPVFQPLARIEGDWAAIEAGLQTWLDDASEVWLEILYRGDDILPDLRQRVEAMVAGSGIEVLRIRNNRVVERVLGRMRESETLADLDVEEVFRRCLDRHDVPDAQRPELFAAYREVLADLRDRGEGEPP